MKVFVTGITGKSGEYLLKEIIKCDNPNYQFTFLVRNEQKSLRIKRDYPQGNILLADIVDNEVIGNELRESYDVLLHVSGISNSERLVDLGLVCGIKWFILVHTTGIYSKYKAAGENYRMIERRIADKVAGKRVSTTILRPTMIYGTVHDQNVAVFMKMVWKLRLFPVVDHASYELQPVFCGDLGKAYYDVLTHPEATKDKDYILSGGAPIKLIDMFKVMATKLEVKNTFINVPFCLAYSGSWLIFLLSLGKLDYREKVQRLVEPRIFSHELATKDFGYNPLSFEEGINAEIQEFKELYAASKK